MTEASAAVAVAKLISERTGAIAPYRAIVTGISGGLVAIRGIEATTGSTAGYAQLAGFALAIGDEVACVNLGKTPIILGKLQRAAPSLYVIDANGGSGLQLWNGTSILLFSDAGITRTLTLQALTGYIYFGTISSATPSIRVGSGTPEGSVTSSPPSLYLRTDTGQVYIKESGVSTNTGWVLLASVTGPTFLGDVTFNKHILVGGSAPSIVKLTAAGTTGAASITEGKDTSGVIQLVPGGTGIAAGSVATFSFALAMPGSSYSVQLTPYSSAARGVTPGAMGPTNRSSTSWDLVSPIALTSGSTYQWGYHIIYHG